MNESHDPNRPQGGALAQVGDVAKEVLGNAIEPILAAVESLKQLVDHHVGRIDRFDERLSVLESMTKNLDGEFASIQGRVKQVSAADMKHARMFPCAVCGAPNEFHPMPGEDDENARNRVCCNKCGIPQGNPVMVERGLEALGKK